MRNYERLSQFYDLGWGKFARNYEILISGLFNEYGIKSARALDLACGTGILSISLVRQGHSVWGIDLSPEMIAIARAKAAGLGNPAFEQQDITRFQFEGEFDLVSCSYDALNYLLDRGDLVSMLVCVSSSLRKKGFFVFDSITHHHFLTLGSGSSHQKIGGQSFIQNWNYDEDQRKSTTIFRFSDKTFEVHHQRPYDLHDLGPLIADCGLQVVETLSWFDGQPYDLESKRLICVAQKI